MRNASVLLSVVIILALTPPLPARSFDLPRFGPRLENVETRLLQGKFNDAKLQFLKDNKRPGKIYGQLGGVIKFLRELNLDYSAVRKFDVSQIETVRSSAGAMYVNGRRLDIQRTLALMPNRMPPFSPEFSDELDARIQFVQEQHAVIAAAFEQHLRDQDQRKIEVAKQAEADSVAAARNRSEKVTLEATRREQTEVDRRSEAKRLDQAARAAGYAGFEDINLLKMLGKASREGNHEKYLRRVIGCNTKAILPELYTVNPSDGYDYCERWYPSIRILQVGTKSNLYQFRVDGQGWHLFLVRKQPGKLYTEGQPLMSRFHVFSGMHTYTTTVGGSKTVPVFSEIAF